MFGIFKEVKELKVANQQLVEICIKQGQKINALADYHNLDYFNGTKHKPHYRKRVNKVKKIGRPKKK